MPFPPVQPRTRIGLEKSRRSRTILACDLCRAKKYKCDGHLPCTHCRRRGVECVFHLTNGGDPAVTEYSIASVGVLKKKLDAAEAVIRLYENEIAKHRLSSATHSDYALQQSSNAEDRDKHSGPCQGKPSHVDGTSLPPPSQSNTSAPRQDSASAGEAYAMNSDELMEINSATKNFEFHGRTSVVALFNGLTAFSPAKDPGEKQRSVVSDFHNDKFLGQARGQGQVADISHEDTHALHALLFIDSYFKSFHFIHPILEQGWFLMRCNDLWAGRTKFLRQSFLALYFSVLSLGACVRVWTEPSINGMDRLQWSRLLFEKSERALGRSGSVNDLEAVQAPLILALLCQQQLELNLAYSFLGRAIRTALSTGINRKVVFANRTHPQDSPTLTVGRTWWALYNLEIELCFTLGRPDTLGANSCHDRPVPPIDESENAIIPITHRLSDFIRQVSAEIYISREQPAEKLRRATQIELELDQWLGSLPAHTRPPSGSYVEAMQNRPHIGSHYWARLQILTLTIRYLHLKILLFYLFLIHEDAVSANQLISPDRLRAAAEKCRSAARNLINVLHWTYRMHHGFQTWGYNATYIALGTLVFLSTLTREPFETRQNSPHFESINQSLEVLEAMEDCNVAQKIGQFVKEYLATLLDSGMAPDQSPNDQFPLAVPNFPFSDLTAFLAEHPDGYQAHIDTFNFFEQGLEEFMPQ